MKPAWVVGVVAFLGSPVASPAVERPIVAVFEIEDKSKSLGKILLGQLTEYLANEVGKAGVFHIVPPGDLKRALSEKKAESHKECFDTSCQVELGRELSATKTLSTSVLKIGGACTVSAALYDLKRMATDLTASTDGDCMPVGLKASVEKVAAELRAWGSGGKAAGFQEGAIGDDVTKWEVGVGEEVIARFTSIPAGASVLMDGRMLCKETPCSKSVPSGPHRISMQAERYVGRDERVVLAEGATIEWRLQPDFGWLTVRSSPPGLEVKLNGEVVGKTPLEGREVAPGGYEVTIGGPCYHEIGERVRIERNQAREVDLVVAAREAGLSVKARDAKGNDIEAEVLVDGQKVGATPGRFKVGVCAKEAVIRHVGVGSAKEALSLTEKLVTVLEVELKGWGQKYGVAGLDTVDADQIRKACDGGDMDACRKLGECYESGTCGLPKNLARAGLFFKQACDGGNSAGCSNLGGCYASGGCGLARDMISAGALYKRACDGGDAHGCFNLGSCYARRDSSCGLDWDVIRAGKLYKQACDSGDADGCFYLGICYKDGQCGLPKDEARAAQLYKQACDAGVQQACRK